jgi:hypothetical protein
MDGSDASSAQQVPGAGGLRRRLQSKRPASEMLVLPVFDAHVELGEEAEREDPPAGASEQPPVEAVDADAAGADIPVAPVCAPPPADGVRPKDLKPLAWTRIRNMWIREKLAEMERTGQVKPNPMARAKARRTLLTKFSHCREEEKVKAALQALAAAKQAGDDPAIVALLEERAGRDPEHGKVFVDRRKAIMLTFNGPWGLLSINLLPQPASLEMLHTVELCRILAQLPLVVSLAKELEQHVRKLAKQLGVPRWSGCLELCETTVERPSCSNPAHSSEQPVAMSGTLRIHGHVFLDSDVLMTLKVNDALRFRDTKPHVSKDTYSASSARGRGSASASAAGHYYIQAPKTSSILSFTNYSVYTNWGLRPEWITQYWSQGKMTDEAAIGEYLRLKRDSRRHVQNVRDNQAMRADSTVSSLAASVRSRLSVLKRPRIQIPAVEEEFLPQFLNPDLHRRKFLVLDGGTGFGKTEFARALAKNCESYLELNCANTEHVDLRAYSPVHHDVIIWDEAPATLVLANKKLFQGQAVEIQMGQTNTSMNAYTIFPWGCKMVVCSNLWEFQLMQLPHHDVDWLRKNSIVVRVSQPLWQQAADGGA